MTKPIRSGLILLTTFALGAASTSAQTKPAPAPKPAAPPAKPAATSAADATFKLKPGAKGKACLGCHADFQGTIAKAFVHTPVKNGNCSDCHSPHASEHGKLLAAETNGICITCHAGLVPEKARSAHPDVVSGNCVTCHDPHASPNKGVLLRAGNDLCLECHKDLGTALKEAKFRHTPVDKSCLGCHNPHATAETDFLLAKSAPALCLGCHKSDKPEFQKAHLGYPVANGDCSSCHDPHGSNQPAILWATVHQPVRAKMCVQCHNEAASPDALKVKREGLDGCKACHSDVVNTALNMSRVHWPVVDRNACLNCHSPHASKARKLLFDKEMRVCASCHLDSVARIGRSATPHQPITDGDCSVCHQPHASNALFLLAGNKVEDTCGNCHDWGKHSSHPYGEKVLDPRNKNLTTDCLSCHRTHGTEFKHLAHFDTKKDLCVQCHSDMAR